MVSLLFHDLLLFEVNDIKGAGVLAFQIHRFIISLLQIM